MLQLWRTWTLCLSVQEAHAIQKKRQKPGRQGKKGQGRAYVAEGTCWEETDEKESEQMVNLALMANSTNEVSSSSTRVPSLVLLDMNFGECKKTIEDMSVEMFNLHTSLSAAHEEIVRVNSKNETLTADNDLLLLKTASLDSSRSDNDKLKNDLDCAKKIEEFLRTKLAENEFKLKAYKNSSQVVQDISEKGTKNNKLGIGYECGRRPSKESLSDYVDNDTAKPLVLRKVQKPVFKYVESVFDEEALLIKQELNDEDSVSNSVIVNEKSTVKRPVTIDSIHSQIAHPKIVVNKAEAEPSNGTVKRKL